MPWCGGFELADLAARGAGEAPALVAEQLAFQQALGQRRAIQADERPFAPRAGKMHRPGDQFLADAAFAANQHRGVRRRGAGDLVA